MNRRLGLWLAIVWAITPALASPQEPPYRPVVAVLSFAGPGGQILRDQIAALLEQDSRLQILPPDLFERTGETNGYTLEDLFAGKGIDVIAKETLFDGVLTGQVSKLGSQYELSLRVYDGGTGFSLLATTITLPKLLLHQKEKTRIASEVGAALAETRLNLPPSPQEEPQAPPKMTKAQKRQERKLTKQARREAKKKARQEKAALAALESPTEQAVPKAPPPEEQISKALTIKEEPPPNPLPEEDPSPRPSARTNPYGTFSLIAGPALMGRLAIIQPVDENGAPLVNFEPTRYLAPAYGGASLSATLAPFALFSKSEDPSFLLEGDFTRSFGLTSNLEGQAINTLSQTLSLSGQLRIWMQNTLLVVRGDYTQHQFAFLLSPEQEAGGLRESLNNLGLIDLSYHILGGGPELQLPLGRKDKILFFGGLIDAILSSGPLAVASYGLVEQSLGLRVKAGTRLSLGKSLLLEAAAALRFWQVAYEGGGSLLDGEASRVNDLLFGGHLSLGYAYQ